MFTYEQIEQYWEGSRRRTAKRLASLYNKSEESIRRDKEFIKIYDEISRKKQDDKLRMVENASSGIMIAENYNNNYSNYDPNGGRRENTGGTYYSLDELLDHRCLVYQRKLKQFQDNKIKTVAAGAKPVAILHLGDPHLDDDGCDLPLLREHITLCSRAKGVYAGNIGDTTNNWVGRLEKLYAKQSSTLDDAIALAEWLCKSMEWAYFVIGNHDSWNQGSYILKLLLRQTRVWTTVGHECRLSLRFDNGAIVNICARHDHKGRSMYHSTHGALKAHIFGDRWADLHISGHTHQWGMMHIETEDGKPRWAIRVRGYKRMDDFAEEKGFYEHRHGSACLTVINPYTPVCDRILVFWDVPTGLKYLESIR